MRFSTLTSTLQFHKRDQQPQQKQQSISNIKRALATIVSKLPHQQKVVPDTTTTVTPTIKVISKNGNNKPVVITAIKKDTDMYRDVRNYYAQQSNNRRKRQASSTTIEEEEVDYNKKLFLQQPSKRELQERCHKTVKQYQQTTLCHHWKEEYSTVNKYAPPQQQQPKWLNTHVYVRGEWRSNSNYFRVAVLSNQAAKKEGAPLAVNKLSNHKPFLKKRRDEFIWGSPSPLRNSITSSSCL